jgi:hypothetical protein
VQLPGVVASSEWRCVSIGGGNGGQVQSLSREKGKHHSTTPQMNRGQPPQQGQSCLEELQQWGGDPFLER